MNNEIKINYTIFKCKKNPFSTDEITLLCTDERYKEGDYVFNKLTNFFAPTPIGYVNPDTPTEELLFVAQKVIACNPSVNGIKTLTIN